MCCYNQGCFLGFGWSLIVCLTLYSSIRWQNEKSQNRWWINDICIFLVSKAPKKTCSLHYGEPGFVFILHACSPATAYSHYCLSSAGTARKQVTFCHLETVKTLMCFILWPAPQVPYIPFSLCPLIEHPSGAFNCSFLSQILPTNLEIKWKNVRVLGLNTGSNFHFQSSWFAPNLLFSKFHIKKNSLCPAWLWVWLTRCERPAAIQTLVNSCFFVNASNTVQDR